MAIPLSPFASRRDSGIPCRSTYIELPPQGWGPLLCGWIGAPGWAPRSLRLLPDGCVDVVWDGSTITVVPPRPVATRHTLTTAERTIGVRLRPGWAAPLLQFSIAGLPAAVNLIDLRSDPPIATLEQALSETATPVAAAQVLARRLAQLVSDGTVADCSVLTAVDRLSEPGASVQSTASQVGLSVRELRRRFHDQVGLSPKAYQRVARFQRFRRLISSPRPPATMAQAAALCGYSDQAHLAHECRHLGGGTPSSLGTTATGQDHSALSGANRI